MNTKDGRCLRCGDTLDKDGLCPCYDEDDDFDEELDDDIIDEDDELFEEED